MPEIVNILDRKTGELRPIPLPHGARVVGRTESALMRLSTGEELDWREVRVWWRDRGVFDHGAHNYQD